MNPQILEVRVDGTRVGQIGFRKIHSNLFEETGDILPNRNYKMESLPLKVMAHKRGRKKYGEHAKISYQ